jgi:hypothetical protein
MEVCREAAAVRTVFPLLTSPTINSLLFFKASNRFPLSLSHSGALLTFCFASALIHSVQTLQVAPSCPHRTFRCSPFPFSTVFLLRHRSFRRRWSSSPRTLSPCSINASPPGFVHRPSFLFTFLLTDLSSRYLQRTSSLCPPPTASLSVVHRPNSIAALPTAVSTLQQQSRRPFPASLSSFPILSAPSTSSLLASLNKVNKALSRATGKTTKDSKNKAKPTPGSLCDFSPDDVFTSFRHLPSSKPSLLLAVEYRTGRRREGCRG